MIEPRPEDDPTTGPPGEGQPDEERLRLARVKRAAGSLPPEKRRSLLHTVEMLEGVLYSHQRPAGAAEGAQAREGMQQALQRNETLLSVTRALTQAGTFETHPSDPARSYWSPETFRILGLPSGRQPPPLDEVIFRYVHEDDRERVLAARREAVSGGMDLDVRCRIRRPDGSVRLIHARGEAIRDEAGRVLRIVGSILDVTAQEVAQEALDRLLRELADLKDALDRSALVATTDACGVLKSVNDGLCAASGFSRDELLGRDFRGLLPDPDAPRLREGWRRLSQGRAWSIEARLKRRSGEAWWAETTVVPFLDAAGRPYQYLAILHDVTERRRAQDQLFEKTALARLGEMATVVAHEVRNPLAAARGALQVIAPRLASERDRGVVEEVVTRLGGLNRLIEDLLLFARPRAPKMGPVSVVPLIRSTLDLFASDPELASVEVVLEVPSTDLTLRGDVEALKSVLLNLLRNAGQAVAGRGRVEVRVRERDGWCEVSIRDGGPGIPVEQRERVFEPFFTTKHRGTGLGLPITRGIVEGHRGRLSLECPPEGGTVVTIRLRLETPDEAPAPA